MRLSLLIAGLLLAFGVWNLAIAPAGLKFVEPAPAELASAGSR